MQIPKPSDQVKALFQSVIPDAPGVAVKPMFGNLGAFVNGNMFAGLFGDSIGVRVLHDGLRAELSAIDGVGPFGPVERPMGGYLALPTAWSQRPELLAQWIERALVDVAELPEKKPKSRRT
ncbi:TfoX/Sxy family protein [Rathayibacter soli]|uniref:TfoX/Sxy family protein n=1 Tax=Rathayibacter soli TaxID=3144168 RepID=UPI0027E478F7|nr:TfoX/Sxy family protein [Glaciibacter superstes]